MTDAESARSRTRWTPFAIRIPASVDVREVQAPTQLLGRADASVVGRVEEAFRVAARRVRTRLVNRSGLDVLTRFGTADMGALGPVLDRYRNHEGGVYARVRLGPGDVPGFVIIEGALLQRLVGIALGDQPEDDSPVVQRPPTSIDLKISRRIISDVFAGLIEGCAPGGGARAKVELVTANPGLALPLPRSAMVLEASFDFGPPERPYGLMSFLFPAELANTWWPARSGRPGAESDRAPPDGIQRVMPIPITLVAELGRLKLTLADLRQIRPGTVFDISGMREVHVRIGERIAFSAEPGEQSGVRSVRVKARLDGSKQKRG